MMLRHDYSWSERVVGFWCPLTLGILAVTSLGLRYVTDPIACWLPAQFTSSYETYAHETCFKQTEIYEIKDHDIALVKQHTYHQWVPFALGIAAILCLLPHVSWRMLSGLLWLDPHALVQTLADNQRHNPATRHVMLKDSALVLQAGLKGGNWVVTAATLGRKVLACVVCLVEVMLVAVLFKPQLTASAGDVKENDHHNEDESEAMKEDYNSSVPLPRAAFCSFSIRQLQRVMNFEVQCTYPLAEVYSKGFTFLFYFFVLVMLCCLLDILVSLCRLLLPGLRDASIHRYLAVGNLSLDPSLVARFVDSVGLDGRLVVAVTADVCGPVAAADLTNHLWAAFKSSPRPAVSTQPGPQPLTLGAAGPPPISSGQAPPGMVAGGDGRNVKAVPLLPVGGVQGEKATAPC